MSETPEPTQEQQRQLRVLIDKAVLRIVNGQAAMRVPADPSDPDIVLRDCAKALDAGLRRESSLRTQLAEAHQRLVDAGELHLADATTIRQLEKMLLERATRAEAIGWHGLSGNHGELCPLRSGEGIETRCLYCRWQEAEERAARAEERIVCCHRLLQDAHAIISSEEHDALSERISQELNGDCPHTCGACERRAEAAEESARALREVLRRTALPQAPEVGPCWCPWKTSATSIHSNPCAAARAALDASKVNAEKQESFPNRK